MEYSLIKKVYNKAKRAAGIKPNAGVIIKSSKWMREQAECYEKQTLRDFGMEVGGNVKQIISYPHLSRMIECAVNELAEKNDNTINNMLVIKNPYQYSPLSAYVLFQTKKPYKVRVTVKGKTPDCDISYTISEAKHHRVPVLGLYPDYKNTVDIELLGKNGKRIKKKTFQMNVEKLKGKNSAIKVQKEVEEVTYLYNLTLVYGGGDDSIFPYAFDRNGDIRFCFAMAPKTYGFQPISGGKFLFLNKRATRVTFTNPTSTQLFEVDQMGRIYRIYNVEKGTHHDFAEIKNGNFVVGSNAIEGKTYEDTVVEIDRTTGEILKEIRIKDYLDPKYVDSSDWAHLNSIAYNEEEKTVVVCLRNLHTVLKINYEKKELEWILANPKFWTGSTVEDKVLIPDEENMKWFFQAHAAYFIDSDLDDDPDTKFLMIYDNHTDKRRPVSYFDKEPNSYVRIYRINEKLKTVSLFCSYPFEKSTIRSNGIFEKESRIVLAMNGKVKDTNCQHNASIIAFDYDSGKILNKYTMNYGFYRAYGFEFAPDKMAQSMEIDKNYSVGKVYEMCSCEGIDISDAKKLPKPVLEEPFKTEGERRTGLNKLVTKNPDYYVDPEQDMARIKLEVEEDILYVDLIDHLLEKIYFVGENNTYCRDFTDTKQERPEYFARAGNRDLIPLNHLEEDIYEIYFKHSVGLYQSGYKIIIKK